MILLGIYAAQLALKLRRKQLIPKYFNVNKYIAVVLILNIISQIKV